MPEQSLCLSWNIRAVQFGIRRRLALGRLAAHGVLPRKTFSMGTALEKRYYLEARMIRSDR